MPKITGAALIGLGGVGSALVGPLAALLHSDPDCWGELDKDTLKKPHLIVVDGDKYEEKNLRNQCIRRDDIGVNKADYAAMQVSGLVDVEPWDRYLSGPLEIVSWLVTMRAAQQRRHEAGNFGGVALIVTAVDDDHCRRWVYEALLEVPNVSVLVVDPSNGAGADADVVDVVTYLRVNTGDEMVEPWPSPLVKFAQLRHPKGRPAHQGCAEEAVSEPQLRTSNMLAATLTYDCIERYLNDGGMVEGWYYDRERGLRTIGARLPTRAEMEGHGSEATVTA